MNKVTGVIKSFPINLRTFWKSLNLLSIIIIIIIIIKIIIIIIVLLWRLIHPGNVNAG